MTMWSGTSGQVQCTTMCTNGGRYCSTDLDRDFNSELTGVDVVHESARRLCIWENFGDDGVGLEWWDYVRGCQEGYGRCGN